MRLLTSNFVPGDMMDKTQVILAVAVGSGSMLAAMLLVVAVLVCRRRIKAR